MEYSSDFQPGTIIRSNGHSLVRRSTCDLSRCRKTGGFEAANTIKVGLVEDDELN